MCVTIDGPWGGGAMEKVVNCDCGWSFQGEDDALVAAVQQHGRETHGMDVTPEQALAMAEPA
jgi:predicted small metal-binding protein